MYGILTVKIFSNIFKCKKRQIRLFVALFYTVWSQTGILAPLDRAHRDLYFDIKNSYSPKMPHLRPSGSKQGMLWQKIWDYL